jgi:hypothetical protein
MNETPRQGDRIEQMLATIKPMTPSTVKYTQDFEKHIVTGKLKIYANRPLYLSKVPLGLLEPIFGSFCDLSTTINPAEMDNYAFLVLRSVMSKRKIEKQLCIVFF